MTITNPDLFDAPIASRTGRLAPASQIILEDNTTSEASILALRKAGFIWLFDDSTSETDPGDNNFRFDDGTISDVTNIYLDKAGQDVRIDEYINQLSSGSFIFVQDVLDPSFNALFETNAAVADTGGSTGYFTLSVTFRRSQGSLTATTGRQFRFEFLSIGSSGGGGSGRTDEQLQDFISNFITAGTGLTSIYDDDNNTYTLRLPNNFLAELAETDTNTFPTGNRIEAASTPDLTFIRFWLRESVVTDANAVGTGLRIDEANGTLGENDVDAREGPTFQLNTNADQSIVYMSLTTNYVNLPTDLNTLWMVVKNTDGSIDSTVNVGPHVTVVSGLGVAGTLYQFTSGLNGGSFLHYHNNQTIELFTLTVDQFFEIPEINAPDVDLTRAIKNLSEKQLEGDLQAKVNAVNDLPHDDQFILDQFVEEFTTSTPAALTGSDTIYYKLGAYDTASSAYFTTDFDTGLPPSFDSGGTTWTVVAPHDRTITSFDGLEGGSVNAMVIDNDVTLSGVTGTTFIVYRVTIPTQASATNFFVPFGTTRTVTEINPSSLIKIDRNNVDAAFLSHIENTNPQDPDSRLSNLENKVGILYALAPDINTLEEWSDIYEPERPNQEVVITNGYSLLADYRGDDTRYESAGVTYDNSGTNVVTYTGLTGDLRRIFGVKVPAPSDQVLIWLINGSTRIPFLDMTASGNYRINNYHAEQTAGTPTSNTTFLSAGAGTDGIITTTQNAIFIIPDFPTGATNATRRMQVGVDILVNGADSDGETLITFPVPDTNVAQDRVRRDVTVNLGPLHGSRRVTVSIAYRFATPSPTEYRMILTLESAPSDITVSARDVALTRNYTPAGNVARTDNYMILNDASGNYTFTGENELLMSFHPINNGSGLLNVVPVAVNSSGVIDELNDATVTVPFDGFEDVEIPDSVALPGIEFRTALLNHYLNHSDLSNLLRDRAIQWVYNRAALRTVSTIHAVNEPIDLAAGSTVDGEPIQTTASDSSAEIEVFLATTKIGVGGPVNTQVLPADYTDYQYVHITELNTAVNPDEWRHTTIATSVLNSGVIESTDNIRIQGDTDLNWALGTRTLSIAGGNNEIFRVALVRVLPVST